MKIAFISAEFKPLQGGVGDYTRELAFALARAGHHVQVITTAVDPVTLHSHRNSLPKGGEVLPGTPRQPHQERPPLDPPFRDMLPGPLPERSFLATGELDSPSRIEVIRPVKKWNWRILPILTTLIIQEKPDIVVIEYQTGAYALHPGINFLPRYLRRTKAHPLILTTFHDLRVPYLWPKAGRLREIANWLLLTYSDGVIVTNRRDLKDVQRRGKGRKAALVPIGSNIPVKPPAGFVREEWRQKEGFSRETILLLYFGFLNESKGVITALEALAQLPKERYHLIIIGGQTGTSDPTNEAYARLLKDKIAAEGLEKRLTWTGYLGDEEVSAWLSAADLAVLPFRDGAGFRRGSLLAPLAHNLAVITTSPPGASGEEIGPPGLSPQEAAANWQLVDGVNVKLVPPDDPLELARAIVTLGDDPEKRHTLGKGGRLLVERCQWSTIAADLLDFCAIMKAEQDLTGK